MLKSLAVILILIVFCQISSAQSLSSLRRRPISLAQDTITLDTFSVAPETFILIAGGDILDTSAYLLDFINAKLVWKKNSLAYRSIKDSVATAQFRVFSFLFGKTFENKNLTLLSKNISSSGYIYNPVGTQPELFRMQGLSKNGSISRGITFGNNQDVFVNSSLNLQLAGKLSDNVEILAAITDENIPIQPEGNTQQLQDFDRVFIQLSNNKNKLIAGDFDLKRPDSYFMNFLKRGQGAMFTSEFSLAPEKSTKKRLMRTGGSIAVSKGKFARQTVATVEANQGPYKLYGNNGETFIIILAGSERVYIDGQLLVRGLQNDYTIDYNTSELTFTARKLITKDSRVNIEFEYTDRNYARSLYYINNEFESDKLKLKLNFYSEQDSKNQPLTIQLDSAKKALMADVGDSIQNAFYPTVDSVAFNSTNVLYQRIDSTVNAVVYHIYKYSTSTDSAYWQVSFSNVGTNNGNYVQDVTAANGRVYAWIAPMNGIPQGSFEPISLLITPKKHQLLTLGADYKLNDKNLLTAEFALSNNDINLFSKKDKSNDAGLAGRFIYSNVTQLTSDTTLGWRLNSNAGFEHISKNFKPLERFRAVEFERDWNLNASTLLADEDLGTFQTSLVKPRKGSFTYQLKSYSKSIYNGLMNSGSTQWTLKNFNVIGNISYLHTKGSANRTYFLRHNANVSRKIKSVVIGVKESAERNRFSYLNSDTLFSNSYSWQELQAYASKADSSKSKLGASYTERKDFLPKADLFNYAAFSKEFNFTSDFSSNPKHTFRTTTTYRSLEVKDTTLSTFQPAKILLNRIDHSVSMWKGVITASTYYEVGTGQERKQEYYYLEVPAGQGVYAYIGDLNSNNVKDLDEFAIAAFSDQGKYIRVYIQTNNYIKTRSNQFSEVFTLTPGGSKSSIGSSIPFLYRFSDQFNIRLEKKTKDEELINSLNPFSRSISDSTLVSSTSGLRNVFYFNRSSPVYGMDFTYQNNQSKSYLANGFETRILRSRILNSRWNISRAFLVNTTYENGEKSNNSEYFTTRDYRIFYDALEPKITYQPGNSFRVSGSYKINNKRNVIGNKEKTVIDRFNLEAKYTAVNSGNITAKIALVKVRYTGDEASFLSYEMLDGFKAGSNVTWGMSVQRNLGSSMQLSLNYDGRKLQGSPVVHTGGVQFRAFF